MFNIKFTRECNQATVLRAEINTDLACEKPVLQFEWNCESQYVVVLLQAHLNKQMWESIERAHRLAYEQGYKDGRSRKKRKTSFGSEFTTGAVAW